MSQVASTRLGFLRNTVVFSRSFFKSYLKNGTAHLFLLVVLLSPILTFCSNASQSSLTVTRTHASVTANLPSPLGTSQFSPGITQVDNTLNYPSGNNDLAAINNVKSLIKNAIPYENTHIMAWGVDDPWPDPSQTEPNNWSSLDSRILHCHGDVAECRKKEGY